MRVLQITDFFHPRMGGIERVVAASGAALRARGIVVEILTRRLDDTAPAHEVIDDVPVWRVGPGPRAFPGLYLGVRAAAREWAREHLGRFDVAHSHQNLVAHGLLSLLRDRVPHVATYYGPWAEEYRLEMSDADVPSRWPRGVRGLATPWVARVLRRLQRDVMANATRRVVLSSYSHDDLGRLLGSSDGRVEVVPGGVDIARFQVATASAARRRLGLERLGDPLLVSVRRLVPRMGLESMLDAVAIVARRWPTVAVAIAGRGPLERRLRERADAIGLGQRVRLLGAVDDAQLAALYAAGDVTVLPTRALEGFGLPVLEAWACGRPVVATGSGALPETVAQLDPRFVARDMTPTALADALSVAIDGGGPEIAERARGLAESYSWDKVTDQLVDVYHRALAG